MALARVHSRAQVGVTAPAVSVEVHLSNGLPAFHIVGLPEASVKEAKDRVRSAIINSRFDFPMRRITVNLAPADIPKDGARFDLAIALGILAAAGQIPSTALDTVEVLGELSLGGELRNTKACLPAAAAAAKAEHHIIVPQANASEAALAEDCRVLAADTLLSCCAHLRGEQALAEAESLKYASQVSYADLSDVKGQPAAKRALEIAAAGGHSVLMQGPPGTGKTLLANRLPGLLPSMSNSEALETAALMSICQRELAFGQRPFRAPHHTASGPALVGGGSTPQPGEISLAHNGVLFLDELPEFPRKVLEVLREPLESGHVSISRAKQQVQYPARFQLIAAMNPCPCGFLGDSQRACRCTPDQVQRYRQRLSGPLLDRIDMHISVARLSSRELHNAAEGEPSAMVQARVEAARQRQIQRQTNTNAQLTQAELREHCALDQEAQGLLYKAELNLGLSARGQHRIIKVARSIADLAAATDINSAHIAEAISYRSLFN